MSEWEDVPDDGWEDVPESFSGPAPQSKMSLKDRALGIIGDGARVMGLSGRTIINTAASLPLAAADFGVGARNLAMGESNPNATQMYNDALNQMGVPEPQGMEKASDVVGQMLLGSKFPIPQAGSALKGMGGPALSQTATTYGKAPPLNLSVLDNGRKAGLVVPPTTTNPTFTNKMLEGAAGKLTTAQMASAKNTEQFNTLAKSSLGLPKDAPLTLQALQSLRQDASGSYEALRGIGTIRADSHYANDLANITAKYRGASKDFPELAKSEVLDAVESVRKQGFSTDSAIDAISILRDKATKAYATGDKTLGSAYRQISGAMEDAIERSLQRRNQPELLKNFKNARQLIAKTYSVESALNQSTGNISGTKLAQQLAKGKPLTGELKTAAQFAQAFPKASRDFNESLPGISPLDFYGAGGISAMSQQPWYLLYPFARQAARQGLLSQAGQKLATPTPAQSELPMALGYGLNELIR